jgi:hypothetical protein
MGVTESEIILAPMFEGPSEPDALAAFASEPEQTDEAVLAPPSDELEDLQPQVEQRTWIVRGRIDNGYPVGDPKRKEEDFERTYVQESLSYLGFMQFTNLIGRTVDAAMSGDEGLSMQSMGDVLSVAGQSSSLLDGSFALQLSDFAGMDAFVRGFAKLSMYVPDMLAEAQCIWLRVPLRERLAVMQVWGRPIREGGLSTQEGIEMLNVFVDQNYDDLADFLPRLLSGLRSTWERARRRSRGQRGA